MASMTDQTLVNAILNFYLHNGSALTQPTSPLHLRLMTTTGSNTASGTEATSGNCPGYTATGATMGTPSFGAAASGSVTNGNSVSWTASGSWATINGVEIWDTAGSPVRLLQGSVSPAITGVTTNDIVQFAASSVTANAGTW